MNRYQAADMVQIHTNASNFEPASPKTTLTLKMFMISAILLKMGKHTKFSPQLFQMVGE